jgi:hypothetical protein
MKTPKNIDLLFPAGFGPVVRDREAGRRFYSEALGLEFKEDTNGCLYTDKLGGVVPRQNSVRLRMPPFPNGQLLPKNRIFHGKIAAETERSGNQSRNKLQPVQHERIFTRGWQRYICLI